MQYYVHPGTQRSNVQHTGCTRQQHLLMGRFPHGPFLGNTLQMSLLYIMLYVIIVFLRSYILPPIYGKIHFVVHLLTNTFMAASNLARLRGLTIFLTKSHSWSSRPTLSFGWSS